MSKEQEQRVCIKFCVKLGRNGAETFEMLRTAFVDDNPRSGRPKTSKTGDSVARVRELI